ncbi:YrhB domain-containing protein [Micromonospora sp. NPDC049048]|uniref:YrhB domain-containing protein n=1 Tax=Micromonospora sp. NPDC049048 TaxID=3364263 RepID=UPI00371DFCA1
MRRHTGHHAQKLITIALGVRATRNATGTVTRDHETVISLDSARQLAERFLDAEVRGHFSHPVVIVDSAVEDLDEAYVFPYNGKAYVEADDWHQAMAGNVPVVVNKRTGRVSFSA